MVTRYFVILGEITMKKRLSESPYLTLREDGEYELAKSIGPICDVHSHLALTYVPTGQVDLEADGVAELYLDPETPIDLHGYMNTNFDSGSMKDMRHDLSIGSLTKDGMRATHTAPILERSMKAIGIEQSIILAIDWPFSARNTDGYITVSDKYDSLTAAAAIHPMAPNAKEQLREAYKRGARAYKMHPAVQQLKPDHPRAMELYEVCGELGMPVIWHCGPVGIVSAAADKRCYLKHYWFPIHELPDTTFILGHSGALQYEMACKLPNMYDNVFVEVSCQGIHAINHILDTVPKERILNGSDWPFYHQAISVVKIMEATEKHSEDFRHHIFWKNAAGIFGLESEAA